MNISKQEPGGEELMTAVVEATGLPEQMVKEELHGIIATQGADPKDLTLEQLRSAMIAYLETIHQDLTGSEKTAEPTA